MGLIVSLLWDSDLMSMVKISLNSLDRKVNKLKQCREGLVFFYV